MLRCPQCDGEDVYLEIVDLVWECLQCGYVWEDDDADRLVDAARDAA
jgi:uncharacterized Zn finger protein